MDGKSGLTNIAKGAYYRQANTHLKCKSTAVPIDKNYVDNEIFEEHTHANLAPLQLVSHSPKEEN